MPTKIVGILNCTPDSFSDGQGDLSPVALEKRAKRLVDEGADILDIGGDSTRPGSTCPGVEEEWRRISSALSAMSALIPCSVDTHHAEVARRAIDCGASYINDISGSPSEEMVSIVAASRVSYIFMYNAHKGAHRFGDGLERPRAFASISDWIASTTDALTGRGIHPERLIADPGMGAFISKDPAVSWEVLSRFFELPAPRGGILLGCSRKGFLGTPSDTTPLSRDERSCKAGASAVAKVPPSVPTYLRVHNVALQRDILTRWNELSEAERVF